MRKQGFTLAEIMIGLALFGFVGLALSEFFKQKDTLEARVTGTSNFTEVSLELSRILRSPELCTELLKGQIALSGAQLDLGAQLKQGGTLSSNLKVTDLSIALMAPVIADPTSFGASIQLAAQNPKLGAQGNFKTMSSVILKTDAAKRIVSCGGASNIEISQNTCEEMSGIWNSDNASCNICGAASGTWDSSLKRCGLKIVYKPEGLQ